MHSWDNNYEELDKLTCRVAGQGEKGLKVFEFERYAICRLLHPLPNCQCTLPKNSASRTGCNISAFSIQQKSSCKIAEVQLSDAH